MIRQEEYLDLMLGHVLTGCLEFIGNVFCRQMPKTSITRLGWVKAIRGELIRFRLEIQRDMHNTPVSCNDTLAISIKGLPSQTKPGTHANPQLVSHSQLPVLALQISVDGLHLQSAQ